MELGKGDGRSIRARVNEIMAATKKVTENPDIALAKEASEHAHAQTQMIAAGIDAILQVRDQLDKFEKCVARQAITNQAIAEEIDATRKMVASMEERAAKRDAEAVEEMRSIRMEIETRGEHLQQSVDGAAMAAQKAADAADRAARILRG